MQLFSHADDPTWLCCDGLVRALARWTTTYLREKGSQKLVAQMTLQELPCRNHSMPAGSKASTAKTELFLDVSCRRCSSRRRSTATRSSELRVMAWCRRGDVPSGWKRATFCSLAGKTLTRVPALRKKASHACLRHRSMSFLELKDQVRGVFWYMPGQIAMSASQQSNDSPNVSIHKSRSQKTLRWTMRPTSANFWKLCRPL